jgi:hypothetical protein
MSKYKMDAQQVRARVESIGRNFSSRGVNKVLEAEILTLIEEATGEKLEEPFPRDKVRFGEVWQNEYYNLIFLDKDGSHLFQSINGTGAWNHGSTMSSPEFLAVLKYKHIGTFNFTAGLPK